MAALREILARFGIEVDGKALKEGAKGVDALAKNLKEMAGAAVAGLAVNSVKNFVTELVDLGDSISDTSNQLGLSAQEFQRWQLAAKMTGAETQDLAAGVRVLQKNMAEASKASAFKEIGVDVKDAAGNIRPTTEVLREVGLAIAELPTEAQRTAKAMELLGKGGTKLGPLFNDGAEGLNNLLAELDKAGGGISDDALEKIGEMGDNMDRWEAQTNSLKAKLAVQFFPVLNTMLDKGMALATMFMDLAENSNIFQAAIIVLGSVAVAQALAIYGAYLPIALVIGLLILMVDDLITFVEGGDSVIGRFLDKLLGEGSGDSIAKQIRDDFKDLKKALDEIPSPLGKVEEVLSTVGASVVRFFVEDIPEAWRFFWQDLNAQAGTGGSTFTDYIVSWLEGLVSDFGDFATEMVDALIQGLVDGFNAGVDKVKTAAANLITGGVKTPMKVAIDAHSPSKWADRDYVQDMIGGGLVRGFVNTGRDVRAASEGLAGTMQSGLQDAYQPPPSALGPGPGGAGGGVTITKTIERVEVHANGAKEPSAVGRAAKDGVSQALEEDDDSTLAGLEVFAPG